MLGIDVAFISAGLWKERKQSNLKTTLGTLWWVLSTAGEVVNDGSIFSQSVEIHFLSSFPTFVLWDADTVFPKEFKHFSHTYTFVNVIALKNEISKQVAFI